MEKLHNQARHPEHCTVNIVKWYNFTTFDILGDLCFDEPFGALAKGQYHSWVTVVYQAFKVSNLIRVLRAYPMVGNVIFALSRLFPQAMRARAEHRALTSQKTDRRLKARTDRRDFMRFVSGFKANTCANHYIFSHILRYNDEKGMSIEEIKATSAILITAGSETTATLLSGATFYLLKNPLSLAKAKDEVRQAFVRTSDIAFETVATRLPYLNACLEEALRMYPPVPTALSRRTGPEGDTINGRFVPANVSTSSGKPKHHQSIYPCRYQLVSTHGAPISPPTISKIRRCLLLSAGLAMKDSPTMTSQHVSHSPSDPEVA